MSPVIKIFIHKSRLVSILAYSLFELQIRIDHSDQFDYLANNLVTIVREAVEVLLQISCVLHHTRVLTGSVDRFLLYRIDPRLDEYK